MGTSARLVLPLPSRSSPQAFRNFLLETKLVPVCGPLSSLHLTRDIAVTPPPPKAPAMVPRASAALAVYALQGLLLMHGKTRSHGGFSFSPPSQCSHGRCGGGARVGRGCVCKAERSGGVQRASTPGVTPDFRCYQKSQEAS